MKKKNIELDVDSFRELVSDALDIYSDSVPFVDERTLNLQGTRQITLNESVYEELDRSPDWVSECYPVRSTGTIYGYYPHQVYGYGYASYYQSEELSDPVQAPFKFDKKTKLLVVPYNGFYNVKACFRHEIQEEEIDNGKLQYVVKTITNKDQAFIKLCQAMFMIGVGRSRRAFTLNDLPIIMDAAEIVSEGRELYKEVIEEELPKYQKFYLSYGT
jgi:hypothetical protein